MRQVGLNKRAWFCQCVITHVLITALVLAMNPSVRAYADHASCVGACGAAYNQSITDGYNAAIAQINAANVTSQAVLQGCTNTATDTITGCIAGYSTTMAGCSNASLNQSSAILVALDLAILGCIGIGIGTAGTVAPPCLITAISAADAALVGVLATLTTCQDAAGGQSSLCTQNALTAQGTCNANQQLILQANCTNILNAYALICANALALLTSCSADCPEDPT